MANFIVPNAEYLSIDTTSAPDSTTLSEVIGKKYIITNVGTGGNTLTVTYGTSSKVLADGEAFIVLYDGTIWVVLNDKNYQGDPINANDILIPVNGKIDSQGNEAVQKKISWNPWKVWKESSVTGDLRFERGEAGVFGEYENLWQDPTNVNSTSTQVGEWTKVEQTGGSIGYENVILPIAQDEVFFSRILKKGNTNVVSLLLELAGANNVVDLDFTTGLTTITAGSFDSISVTEIEANQEYKIDVIKTGVASGTDGARVFAARSITTATAGLYTYYKDISYIGGIDYPVPYVKGIHTADSWVHPVNWNESTDWTIDIWFKPNTDSGYAFDISDPSTTNDEKVILYYSGGNFTIRTTAGGAASFTTLSIQPIINQYSHVKAVWISSTSVAVYMNNVLSNTHTATVPATTDMSPIINIGMANAGNNQLNSYISDLMIRPTADVSTTHYDSGLPWTNPENDFNGLHGSYIDKFGNYVGETFTGMEEDVYSVVEQYTIGDQTVTKWSNGDMEISGVVSLVSIAITATSGALFRNVATQTISFLDDFIFLPKIISEISQNTSANIVCSRSTGSSVSSTNLYIFSTTSQASVTVFVDYVIKGTWK